MAVQNINSLTYGGNTFNLKDPTKYAKPSGGIPQTDLEQTVQNKLDKTVVVSDTQPTETENKLWVDTDASAGASYQVPTVAEMQAADNSILGNLAMIESSPATQAHAIGDYIVYNGRLYKVTAAIAQGESLVSGTNVAATDVAKSFGTKIIAKITSFNAGAFSGTVSSHSGRTLYNITINVPDGYKLLCNTSVYAGNIIGGVVSFDIAMDECFFSKKPPVYFYNASSVSVDLRYLYVMVLSLFIAE